MKALEIEQTSNTPHVQLNQENGTFTFIGKSFPENTADFYEPIVAWLEEYTKKPNQKTDIEMQFDYFNTSSAKMILEVFKRIKAIKLAGSQINIQWKYLSMDEEMQEVGEEYEYMIDIPFQYIEIEDDVE